MSTLSEMDAQLRAGKCVVFIRCLHLRGETICLAADDTALPLDPEGRYRGCLVYRLSEIRRLLQQKPDPQSLYSYHASKRTNAGRVCMDLTAQRVPRGR